MTAKNPKNHVLSSDSFTREGEFIQTLYVRSLHPKGSVQIEYTSRLERARRFTQAAAQEAAAFCHGFNNFVHPTIPMTSDEIEAAEKTTVFIGNAY